MKPSTETRPKQAPEQKNLIAIDGTLDRVQGLRLVIQEKGVEADPTQVRMHHRDSVKELIRCHNPNCFQGGFSLGNLLRELVRSRQEDYIGINYCKGYEGDPEITPQPISCDTRFEVSASLSYKPDHA